MDAIAWRPRGALLEREPELAALSELVDGACAGDGHAVVIAGPPGIGKTALLEAVTELAPQRGMRVLAARGVELERDYPFGVVRQLFEPPIASMPPAERGPLFEGAAGIAATLLGAQSPAGAAPPAGELFALLHGLHWLTAGLAAAGPLLLAIDDAHWADGPSLRFAHYLARRLDELPVLLVLTARSTAPEAPVPLVEAIGSEPGASTIRPEPLSTTASAAVLRELFATEPDREFVRASHDASRGNPFLLTELARALEADGRAPDRAACARIRDVRPEAIARNALVRLGQLGPAAQRVARAVATLGDDAAIRHVAALAALPDDDAADAIDHLVAAGILAGGRTVRYLHPLTRAVVYDDLGQAGRARLHKRAAAMLAGEGAEPERVAAHLLLTEPAADEQRRRPAARGGIASPAPRCGRGGRRLHAPRARRAAAARRRCRRSCSSWAGPSRQPRSRGRPTTSCRRSRSRPTPACGATSPRPRRRSCCRPGARRRPSSSSTR